MIPRSLRDQRLLLAMVAAVVVVCASVAVVISRRGLPRLIFDTHEFPAESMPQLGVPSTFIGYHCGNGTPVLSCETLVSYRVGGIEGCLEFQEELFTFLSDRMTPNLGNLEICTDPEIPRWLGDIDRFGVDWNAEFDPEGGTVVVGAVTYPCRGWCEVE